MGQQQNDKTGNGLRLITWIVYLIMTLLTGITAWNAHELYCLSQEVPKLYLTIERYDRERSNDQQEIRRLGERRDSQFVEINKKLDIIMLAVERHHAVQGGPGIHLK